MMLDEASQQLEASQAAFEDVRTRDKEDEERIEAEKAVGAAEKYYAWAVRSQSRGSIGAMLELAAADASIAITHDQLDADPMRLNCANGTIDLREGVLEPHRRESLFTMSSPVAFDPEAKCPTWDKFVSRAMGDDAQMIAYLQRVVGYLITGSTKEHALFFFYGGGANGKSTFTNTLLSMLGPDLAAPSPRDMLFAGKNEHATREAMLYRKRFVLCSEIGEGKRLDEAHVKDITGGDRIAARRMREDFWTFEPTHKIVVSGNHKPIITGTDDGIWRRIRLVPWLVTIPVEERDKDLTQKLAAELPGILTWAVNGCLEWQRVGLSDPQTVTKATSDFRAASDVLTDFFEQLDFGPPTPERRITKKTLRKTYEAWCEAEGHLPLGARRLCERVRMHATDLGFDIDERMASTHEAPHPVRTWFGVRVRG
jgi:putative DNA primase/helicase